MRIVVVAAFAVCPACVPVPDRYCALPANACWIAWLWSRYCTAHDLMRGAYCCERIIVELLFCRCGTLIAVVAWLDCHYYGDAVARWPVDALCRYCAVPPLRRCCCCYLLYVTFVAVSDTDGYAFAGDANITQYTTNCCYCTCWCIDGVGELLPFARCAVQNARYALRSASRARYWWFWLNVDAVLRCCPGDALGIPALMPVLLRLRCWLLPLLLIHCYDCLPRTHYTLLRCCFIGGAFPTPLRAAYAWLPCSHCRTHWWVRWCVAGCRAYIPALFVVALCRWLRAARCVITVDYAVLRVVICTAPLFGYPPIRCALLPLIDAVRCPFIPRDYARCRILYPVHDYILDTRALHCWLITRVVRGAVPFAVPLLLQVLPALCRYALPAAAATPLPGCWWCLPRALRCRGSLRPLPLPRCRGCVLLRVGACDYRWWVVQWIGVVLMPDWHLPPACRDTLLMPYYCYCYICYGDAILLVRYRIVLWCILPCCCDMLIQWCTFVVIVYCCLVDAIDDACHCLITLCWWCYAVVTVRLLLFITKLWR